MLAWATGSTSFIPARNAPRIEAKGVQELEQGIARGPAGAGGAVIEQAIVELENVDTGQRRIGLKRDQFGDVVERYRERPCSVNGLQSFHVRSRLVREAKSLEYSLE